MKAVLEGARRGGAAVEPADQTQLTDEAYTDLEDEISTLTPQLVDDITVRIYASTYTERELKDAIAFYTSDSGRSIMAKAPAIRAAAMSEVVPCHVGCAPERNLAEDRGACLCEQTHCTTQQREQIAQALARAMQHSAGG